MKDTMDVTPINGYRHIINKKYTQINMVCHKQELPICFTFINNLTLGLPLKLPRIHLIQLHSL